ncbi:hypothetical protein BC351_01015 [Paenibacillus ferrarius]|uniref:Uncharacterized protein n=1 Tax=Paenibacillus ferrarius TaxID=1469647 RepID=A0A1V4HTL5_9BACL|nr:hypothetical protein [Paenibacillus ferrarius]OPH61853.1 hypothetical protein BC351_01015 [Paenibacillus ferrarius]
MDKFFNDLKKFMIQESQEQKFNACEYFHTLHQHKDKLTELIHTYENHNCYFSYTVDNTDGYTDGVISIHFNNWQEGSYYYDIVLSSNQMWGGYCQCTPEDEGYNPIHDCCGLGCDYNAPSFNIKKISNVAGEDFTGHERDMWLLQEQWDKDMGIYKEDKNNAQIKEIEKQIASLQKRRVELQLFNS